MRKKVIGIVLVLLLTTTILPLTALAGDESDPEITDNLNDQFGALIEYPNRIRTLIARALLHMESFDFIDINSSWFYEVESEPDYLFAALKVQDLTPTPYRVVYSIHFSFEGVTYAVWSHLCNNAQNASGFIGLDRRVYFNWKDAEATYDFDNDMVTFKFNKKYFGDPQPGDIITKTFTWTALRFNIQPFSLMFSDGELVKDAAPFIENNNDFGRDIEILY